MEFLHRSAADWTDEGQILLDTPPCCQRGRPDGIDSKAMLCVLLASATPFAQTVVAYDPGLGANPEYLTPETALGAPTRLSGACLNFPGCVTPLSPAFCPEELVAVGIGGELVLAFDHPVADDPQNPFGVDLLVFGNAFFSDPTLEGLAVGSLFSEGGTIEVSPDGESWAEVQGAADGDIPTLGYLDATAYQLEPGLVPSDFTLPPDPALVGQSNMSWEEVLAFYGRSGGGTPVDLAGTGFDAIQFVRISLPEGGSAIEIDAVADVRAPATGDVNGDGATTFQDVLEILAAWETSGPADLDHDGEVGFSDLLIALAGS